MSHGHAQVNIDTSEDAHDHPTTTPAIDCGRGQIHDHYIQHATGGAHKHPSCVVTFESAELGSPNWWEHKHLFTVSIPNANVNHAHTIGSTTTPNGCLYSSCLSNPHLHSQSGSCFTTDFTHNHAAGGYTDYADPAGTPENHTHTFSGSTSYGGSHSHNVNVPTVGNQICFGLKNHGHTYTGLFSNTHRHTHSGTSGSGGESAAKPQPIGDGITFTT
jgi:hypothetical protein